jgi:hypothetical protein
MTAERDQGVTVARLRRFIVWCLGAGWSASMSMRCIAPTLRWVWTGDAVHARPL